MISVLIADDHLLLTDLVGAFLVERGFELAGVATSETETLARTRGARPDVCLVDAAALAVGPATTFLSRLTDACPQTRVLVLTGSTGAPGPRAAAEAGAAGHLLKTVSGDELVDAIERAARGEVGVGTEPGEEEGEGTGGLTDDPAGTLEARRRMGALRTRERQCLELIVAGASTEDMAVTMGVTVATVRSHVRAVLAALGVHSRLGAASFVLRHGLLDPDCRAS